MKKALVVGIDHYASVGALFGCVNDAHAVKAILERHGDGSVNFGVKLITGTGPGEAVERGELKDAIEELFAGGEETVLLYFAGHGCLDSTGGFLVTSDSKRGDDGVSLSEVLVMANRSTSANKVIVLDCCHAGIAGNAAGAATAELSEGLSILTASTQDQYASEENGNGVFTNLFVDALGGAAANLVGDVTPGSVYAHIDQSLGPWEQRPVFKTNVKNFVSLREVQAAIDLDELLQITTLFPAPGYQFKLDPSFEPEMKGRDPGMPPPDPDNTRKFAVLQKYNRVNLLVPVDADHMWNAAMESKTCKLTVLGEHYRRLVERGRI